MFVWVITLWQKRYLWNRRQRINIFTALTGEKQAMSITISSFAEGLSGKLKSGDIVAVIAPDYLGSGETVIPDELRFVEIIAVTAKSGSDANTEEQAGDGKELPSTVTVRWCGQNRAGFLADLRQREIHLSLVYRGESTKAAQFIEVQDQVLDEMLEENGGEENGTEGADGEMPYNADSGKLRK